MDELEYYNGQYTGEQIDQGTGIALKIESDLASIHATGSTNTTGAAIQPSTYFYLDGVLVLAKKNIGINALFTLDNYKVISNGALNEPIAKVITRTGEVTSVPANATATVFVSTNGKEEDGTAAYNYAGTLAFAPGNTGLSIDALTFTASGINVIVRNWMNSARNCAPELKILMLKYNLLN